MHVLPVGILDLYPEMLWLDGVVMAVDESWGGLISQSSIWDIQEQGRLEIGRFQTLETVRQGEVAYMLT